MARKLLRKIIPASATRSCTLWRGHWRCPCTPANKIREALRTTRIHHRLAATAYSFYDVLSPEFMHCHSRHEVTEWFSALYAQLRFSPETADIAYAAAKQ